MIDKETISKIKKYIKNPDKIKNEYNIKQLDEGKRGITYTTTIKNTIYLIKIPKKNTDINSRIEIEGQNLTELNKYNLGPKQIYYDKDITIREYVKGKRINEWIKENTKENIKILLTNILKELYQFDLIKWNKFELTNPYKHILVENENKFKQIDFERCKFTINPKNVNQFCQYLTSKPLTEILYTKKMKINKEKIIELSKKYKEEKSKENFNNIIKYIKIT